MVSSLDDSSSSDMDSDDRRPENPRPHQHRKRFSLIEISTRNSVTKIMTFETGCAVMPSSWEVEFNLSKGPQFQNFAMSITLRRTDLGEIPLKGCVIAFFSNFDDKFCRACYSVDGVVPYYEREDPDAEREVTIDFLVDDHYKCLFVDGHEAFPNDMLLIKARLLVMGCCFYTERRKSLRIKRSSKWSFISRIRRNGGRLAR